MSDWATFHGSANEVSVGYKLTAAGENGVFSLPKEFVLFEHGKILVKVGAIAIIDSEPAGTEDLVGFAPKHGCKRSCSIGLVEICCDDGRMIGQCRVRESLN